MVILTEIKEHGKNWGVVLVMRSTLLRGREQRSWASWMETIDMRGAEDAESGEVGVEECTKGTKRRSGWYQNRNARNRR